MGNTFHRSRLNSTFGMALLVLSALGCSILRPKRQLTWQMLLEVDEAVTDREAAVREDIRVIESRLGALGLPNFEVQPQGNGRIVLRLPEVPDRDRFKRVITYWGKLELVHVLGSSSPAPPRIYATREEAIAALNAGGIMPGNRRVLPYGERADIASTVIDTPKLTGWVVVESPPIIDGSDLRTATAVASRAGTGDYDITFSLKKAGAEKFGEWTGKNVNEYLGVVLNDEVKSIAFIRSQIYDQGQITGHFSKESAEDLALALRSGALPARLKIVAEGANK